MALVSIGFALWYFCIPKTISSTEGLPLRAQLAAEIPNAVLLWSQEGMLTGASLKQWKPIPITKGENPRWSPDGRQFVFTKEHDVWLMKNDLSDPVKIIREVVTEHGTGAYWAESGDGIIAISRKNPRQVIRFELASGKTHVIHDENHFIRLSSSIYHFNRCIVNFLWCETPVILLLVSFLDIIFLIPQLFNKYS